MNKTKIILSVSAIILLASATTLFQWQKPKLEALATKYIESLNSEDDIPFSISLDSTEVNLFPPQLKVHKLKLKPKKKLSKTINDFTLNEITIQPSLLDLTIGKFWISHLLVEGSEIHLKIKSPKTKQNKPLNIDLSAILKRVPISQIELKKIKLNVDYQNKYQFSTESLFVRAYNKKSSLILKIKDSNTTFKQANKPTDFSFLIDSHLMVTDKTISLSKLKIIKASDFFLASGNIYFEKFAESIKEMQINTRFKSSFTNLEKWSNVFHSNDYFSKLKGDIRTDLKISKSNHKPYSFSALAAFKKLKIGKVLLGDVDIQGKFIDDKNIEVNKIVFNLAGSNRATIENTKINIDKKIQFHADVNIDQAELHTFLRDSGIADIPVWLKVSGNLSCNGQYEKELLITCPGTASITNVDIKNKSRTKHIIKLKKADIAGEMTITEKSIQYKATASLDKAKGTSKGEIKFEEGFSIDYASEHIDFSEIKEIADLQFKGAAKVSGSTRGDSDAATFVIHIDAEDFEFEDYYFGKLSSKLNYKSGILNFANLKGLIESTRYKGSLDIDLRKDMIYGDIQLPFFRMEDVQQSILKHVDLEERFLGSGSGKLSLNTPFDLDKLTFNLDARLFKGIALGESYNEASLKAIAKDGIINIKKLSLQKEKSSLFLKGNLTTKLESDFHFDIVNGFLQQSTLLKEYKLPVTGNFVATGKITGKLQKPGISARAKVEDLTINKKKYGPTLFSYNNLKKQTSIQISMPEKLNLLVLLPEGSNPNYFVNLEATRFDIAPIIGYLVTKDATKSYLMETSGEISGHINTKSLWDSDFSATIKNIALDYRSNRLESTLPTNIELKNHKLFMNEFSLVGEKQFIKINPKVTSQYKSKLIINSQMNISFFKLVAPFIEKIDGFSTLRLELSLLKNDIRLIGNSFTAGAFIKFPGFPHAFEDLSADVLFNQNEISINSITGRFADGKVLGNGSMKFSGPGDYKLNINANLENIALNFPENMKTWGAANLNFSGKGTPFRLSGDYEVKRGLIEKEFGSSGSKNESNLLDELLKKDQVSPLILDININAENSIEIKNSLIEGDIIGNLRVYDKIEAPRIKGRTQFRRDAIIKFSETEFEVTNSNFEFHGYIPINPSLYARAETRLNGYDIDLLLQGNAINPKLKMSSNPPLPQQQIISMLALGQLPNQQQDSALSNQQSETSNFEIGTSLLGDNPLGKELRDRYKIDIQFSSSFDEDSNVAVPQVTLRKRFSKKLEVSASQSTGNSQRTEGRAEYRLNDQISTIFRIRSKGQSEVDQTSTNQDNRSDTRVGVDLEYKVGFD